MLNRVLMTIGVLLYRIGLFRPVMWLGRSNAKILLYHDIAEQEHTGVRGLDSTVSPAVFERHLRFVTRHYTVLDMHDIVAAERPPRSLAIAFDDGYASVHDHALPLMQRFDVPSVCYLITGVVGNRAMVWVNELNHYLHDLGPSAIRLACAKLDLATDSSPGDIISAARANFDVVKISALLEELRGLAGDDPAVLAQQCALYLDWDQVRAMQAQRMTFGNHTVSHPNMARISEAEQSREIGEARAMLEAQGVFSDHFAYPFGHHNGDTAQIARRLGYAHIAEVGGDNHGQGGGFIGRVHVNARNEAELFAQIEVVEPVKAWLRKILHRPKAGYG